MGRHHTFCQQFKKALLGQEDKRVIGDFVLFKEIDGVGVLSKELYDFKIKCESTKDFKPLTKKLKELRPILRQTQPAPISDEELLLIE